MINLVFSENAFTYVVCQAVVAVVIHVVHAVLDIVSGFGKIFPFFLLGLKIRRKL